jgi:hypothetical protein
MKNLLLFIDMLRVDKLNLYNHSVKQTSIDEFILNLGGTLYMNCYTPGPDTPRSLACIQTGLYPYFNGCNLRTQWPHFYISDEIETLTDICIRNNIAVNIYNTEAEWNVGAFKCTEKDLLFVCHNYDKFVSNELKDKRDSLTFLFLDDYHTAINDYRNLEEGVRVGHGQIRMCLEKYLMREIIDLYDNIFVFSDHGHMLFQEIKTRRSCLDYLDNKRTQILMFHHQKNKKSLQRDINLHCIFDLYATLLNLFDIDRDYRHSISLFDNKGHDFIVINDSSNFLDFSPEVVHIIDQWRVITHNFDFRTNIKESLPGDNNIIAEQAISIIKKYSPVYNDYLKRFLIFKKYSVLQTSSLYYQSGCKRIPKFYYFIFKIKQAFTFFFVRVHLWKI